MRPQSRISSQIRRIKKRAEENPDDFAEFLSPNRPRKRKKSFSTTFAISSANLPNALSSEEAKRRWYHWFESKNRTPLQFQVDAWDSFNRGESGVISVPTGSGKTLAAFGGPLMSLLEKPSSSLSVIYISPLKALARDVAEALREPINELGLPYNVELRTGDTSTEMRMKMRTSPPQVLIITPESLSLMMTSNTWPNAFSAVRTVIIDEWHILMGTKRGCLLELTLSRLRKASPTLQTWVLSATLENLKQAAQSILSQDEEPQVIQQELSRPIEIHSILPEQVSAFPWFGPSGLKLLSKVLCAIDLKKSTLIFTNTRGQAERWYSALRHAKPEWQSQMALHHGSLDRAERERVEAGIKVGDLRLVVATSSLDLGVDFPQVEKVIQIGSMKGFDRAIQRAGRAYHRPGERTAISICPTNLFEILEISALREGLNTPVLEAKEPLNEPLDVLVQFVLNCAFVDGFQDDELFEIIRKTFTYRSLSRSDFKWVLDFCQNGGQTLHAYPQFRKLEFYKGRYRFASPQLARQHRLNMGTIMPSSAMLVRFARGEKLGMIDESFISKLRPGDVFTFGGRTLKLLQTRDMTALVRLAKNKNAQIPVWSGSTFPISGSLAYYLREEIEKLARAFTDDRPLSTELRSFLPTAHRQARESSIPSSQEILVELLRTREGHHLFFYGFEGKQVHEGLGHLVASRLAQKWPNTISVSSNDYGIELLAAEPFAKTTELKNVIVEVFTDVTNLEDDIESSLNFPELAKSAFREIARIAGLLQQTPPGKAKTTRHLQMSSSLLFEVLNKYEPQNPLLIQAINEVRDRQLEIKRLEKTMLSLKQKTWLINSIDRLTPFAFPLLIERMNSRVSTESLLERIQRMQRQLEMTK